jgi:hypothetical protein
MLAAEFPEFESLLKKNSQVFSKKLTDEMVQGYWESLKDLSLSTVTRCAANHMRFAKFFPKPSELRPKDEAQTSVKDEGRQKALVELSIASWDARFRTHPEETRRELEVAFCARLMVRYPYDSWEHQEARQGNYQWALTT